MTDDNVVMEARRLEYAGDTLKERTLAREVNEWHFESTMNPTNKGMTRMLRCAIADMRDHLTKETA